MCSRRNPRVAAFPLHESIFSYPIKQDQCFHKRTCSSDQGMKRGTEAPRAEQFYGSDEYMQESEVRQSISCKKKVIGCGKLPYRISSFHKMALSSFLWSCKSVDSISTPLPLGEFLLSTFFSEEGCSSANALVAVRIAIKRLRSI